MASLRGGTVISQGCSGRGGALDAHGPGASALHEVVSAPDIHTGLPEPFGENASGDDAGVIAAGGFDSLLVLVAVLHRDQVG